MSKNKRQELVVETPMGALVAYPSTDPNNPAIFIDLRKDGVEYTLNLAGVECQIPQDENQAPMLMTHVWGNGVQEDTTDDIEHINIQEYFRGE